MVIQRSSWKIINDNSSNSASSTEAVRSPIILGLSSSSDDSNLSNHTPHSMISRAETPINNANNFTTVSSNSQAITFNLMTNNAASGAGSVTAAGAAASMTTSEPNFVTTPHMAESMLQRLRQRLNFPLASGSNATDGYRSMELMRISVQSEFDKEIDVIIRRFMEHYFRPAFNNIKENLGRNAISEDMLLKMSCALLENAKSQYNAFRLKPNIPAAATAANGVHQLHRTALKRPSSSSNDDAAKKLHAKICPQPPQEQLNTAVASFKNLNNDDRGASSSTATGTQEPLQMQQSAIICTPATATTPARRQIFWNTALINTNTKFVLDVQANPAFGYGTDGRERLASKHPDLIRYLPDQEDRDFLVEKNIIAAHNKNARFLFLIHDELCRLKQGHETYRINKNIDLTSLHTFTVPEFMIQKMKLFFVDLHMKSRGLITNSYSISSLKTQNASASISNTLSGFLVATNSASVVHQNSLTYNTGAEVVNSETNSNSQLRNALLSGSIANVSSNTSNITGLADSSNNTNSTSVSTTSDNSDVSSMSLSPSASTTFRSRLTTTTTSSSLSSSHATLTALLNSAHRSTNRNASTSEISNFNSAATSSNNNTNNEKV